MALRRRLTPVWALIAIVLLSLALLIYNTTRDRSVFRLRRVSAFDLIEQAPAFGRGQRGLCSDIPDANVAVYPAFRSTQPVYGAVRFGSEPGYPNSGVRFCFAFDESGGTGSGYDRLYFDRNRDLDLTNDRICDSLKRPPRNALLSHTSAKRQVCYESLGIPLTFGSRGERSLEVMPRLVVYDGGSKDIQFITTRARKGRIKIAGRRFDVLLGHNYMVSGWFDHPSTALHLIPRNKRATPLNRWGGGWLLAMHEIGGTLYRFSSTPSGHRLTVQPYAGPLGTFVLGPGSRDLVAMDVRGSLRSREACIPVGRMSGRDGLVGAESCRVPAGDYLLDFVHVTYGPLRISLSNNYHSDGQRLSIGRDRLQTYPVRIRADEPFTLDFSGPPVVMFASPARDQRVARGEELQVMAVLTDPVLDTMIRGLDFVKEEESHRFETISLDPKVIVTRADGEVVAEGVMPFG